MEAIKKDENFRISIPSAFSLRRYELFAWIAGIKRLKPMENYIAFQRDLPTDVSSSTYAAS
jgi:hypothetical protein